MLRLIYDDCDSYGKNGENLRESHKLNWLTEVSHFFLVKRSVTLLIYYLQSFYYATKRTSVVTL